MDGPFLADTFTLLDDARLIAHYLIFEDHEQLFSFVRQARIAFVLQQPALMLRGQPAAAYIGPCKVQGSNRLLFEFLVSRFAQLQPPYPLDFLVFFDAAEWTRRGWNEELGASGFPIDREALVYHELCHLRQLVTSDDTPRTHDDGREMLAVARHDEELFHKELERYGPVTLRREQLGASYVIGAQAEKARKRKATKLRIA